MAAVRTAWGAFALLVLAAAGCTGGGSTNDVVLSFDTTGCRNDGRIAHDGIDWQLNDPVPIAWRALGEKSGVIEIEGPRAVFTSDDGMDLELWSDGTDAYCASWDPPPDPLPRQQFDDLVCDEGQGLAIEAVEGDDPAQILLSASPAVIEVSSDDEGRWWGYDEGGMIVVGLISGASSYQLVLCTP